MKKSKRFLSCLVIAAFLIGTVSGCDQSRRTEIKSIKIGITVYDQYDAYISQLLESLNEYASEKSAESGVTINVEVYNASKTQSTQNSQVESMINGGCDIVCVNLVDRTDTTAIVDLGEEKKVPIIFFNRELVEEDLQRSDKFYYVGAKALESGIMQGELVTDFYKKDPSMDKNGDGNLQYVILEGEAGHQDSIMRTEYSVSTISNDGVSLEKLDYAIANWNRDQAQTKMTQMLNLYGSKIELVMANNDVMALGAIDALKAANIPKEDWPAVFGIDGIAEGLQAVIDGEMKATVYNDKEGQAKAIVNLAYALAVGDSLNNLNLESGKYIRLPYKKVTMNNVYDYMNFNKSASE